MSETLLWKTQGGAGQERLSDCENGVSQEPSKAPAGSLELSVVKGPRAQQLKISDGGRVMARVPPKWTGREGSLTF